MIKINIILTNDEINKVVISGHANYKEAGKDIVCSAVSSIITTTINAIIRINSDSIKYEEKDGFVSIQVINNDTVTLVLLKNMVDLLEQLEKQYKKFIKINKEVSSC